MVGKTLSHYKIVSEIGRGGMGIVYRAYDQNLDREVAIKVLPKIIASQVEHQRFEREAKAAGRLNHPSIATIYDFDTTDPEHPLIVMELVDGSTVQDLIRDEKFEIEEIIRIAADIADGLDTAHVAGIIHRDVKPSNIMISESGRVKILDFGLAKHSEGVDLTKSGSTTGTAAYMSPEQITGKPVDVRTDIWSLGVMIYEMLTGKRPFAGEYEAAVGYSILNTDPNPASETRAEIPDRLLDIVSRTLNKDPDERHESAAHLRDELISLVAPHDSATKKYSAAKKSHTPVLIAGVVIIAVIAVAAMLYSKQQDIAWVQNEAIPGMEELIGADRFHEAFLLGERALNITPTDPDLVQVWSRTAVELKFTSDPPGATISALIGVGDAALLRELGTTPLSGVWLPFDVSPLKIEKVGHKIVERLIFSDELVKIRLDQIQTAHPRMVLVEAGTEVGILLPGMEHLARRDVNEFMIDQFETTNAEYKRFLDDGGYENKDFWKELKADVGEGDRFEAVMAGFIDPTGRQGPSTWLIGDYPGGEQDYPVTGISWYESTAYCHYTGKQLPTIYHWNSAATPYLSDYLIPKSNFSNDSVSAVGAYPSMGVFGTYDMAGNVREWIWNEFGDKGDRAILGGAWNDPSYMSNSAFALQPSNRSGQNGLRCARMLDEDWDAQGQAGPLAVESAYYDSEEPVSDETFEIFERMYQYDNTPLNARTLLSEMTPMGFPHELIEFDAAYGGEKMLAHLFKPNDGPGPFQTVIYFPGANAINLSAGDFTVEAVENLLGFILQDGRAILYPIYKGTFDRNTGLGNSYPNESSNYRDHVIMWSKDLGRSIDYLKTRGDIDSDHLAYMGTSWGARIGGTLLGIEHRFKGAILFLAGIRPQRSQPEADPIHFLPRVKTPTIILGGEHDFLFPVETSQRPFFEAMGLNEPDKAWKIYPGGHCIPQVDLIRETLAWLDKYLGPTQ